MCMDYDTYQANRLRTLQIYMPCRHQGTQASSGKTPLLQSPHENELSAELYSSIMLSRILKKMFLTQIKVN